MELHTISRLGDARPGHQNKSPEVSSECVRTKTMMRAPGRLRGLSVVSEEQITEHS